MRNLLLLFVLLLLTKHAFGASRTRVCKRINPYYGSLMESKKELSIEMIQNTATEVYLHFLIDGEIIIRSKFKVNSRNYSVRINELENCNKLYPLNGTKIKDCGLQMSDKAVESFIDEKYAFINLNFYSHNDSRFAPTYMCE